MYEPTKKRRVAEDVAKIFPEEVMIIPMTKCMR